MSPFEKFIREYANANNPVDLQIAIKEYDETKVDYVDDPVRWATQLPDVVDYLQAGRLVSAVRVIRDAEQGPHDLRQCKELANQVEDSLGIKRYRY